MPRLLDLFCGAGGTAMGYYQAGFEVIGVDMNPQPHFPFEFIQADAMTFPIEGFDVIHASPPCQLYSAANRFVRRPYPDLVGPIRQRIRHTGLPYVIENVPGAPLLNPGTLCGTMFGLSVYRHRLFESNLPLTFPSRCTHPHYLLPGYVCIYGGVVRGRQTGNTGNHYETFSAEIARQIGRAHV